MSSFIHRLRYTSVTFDSSGVLWGAFFIAIPGIVGVVWSWGVPFHGGATLLLLLYGGYHLLLVYGGLRYYKQNNLQARYPRFVGHHCHVGATLAILLHRSVFLGLFR